MASSCREEEGTSKSSIDFAALTKKKWITRIPFKLNNGQITGMPISGCFDYTHYFLENGKYNEVVECKIGTKDGGYPFACFATCKDTLANSLWSVDHVTSSIKFNLGDGTIGNARWEVHTLNDTVLIATALEESFLTGKTDVYLKALE